MPIADTTDQPTRRRRWVIAALLLLLLFSLLAASFSTGRPTAATPDRADPVDDSVERMRNEGAADADPEAPAGPVAEPAIDPNPDPGDPGESDFDDGGAGPDPCAAHDPADGSLFVTPDPLVLPSGQMDGQLDVRNCGTEAVAWSAATKPSVALATLGGTLDPGEVFPVELTIDSSQWEPGAIDFKVRVTEGEFLHNTYVDVQAFRPFVGADMVATDEISAGPGEGGCSLQCITKAKLTTGYSSPDVGLEVATTVPARLRVYLSKNPPVMDPQENPKFPGKPPKAMSPNGVQSWKTTLAHLQPTTKYFIIVKATDADGDSAYQHGSFKTITLIQEDVGLTMGGDEPGCSADCITKATVTPGDGAAPAKVVVRTHTPAVFDLKLSTKPPITVNGHPDFEKKPVWHTSGLDYIEAWDDQVTTLLPATTYYGIITARDANGHASYATGQFTTDGIDVVITIHNIHVSGDGDAGGKNRGELSFVWGVDGPEAPINAGWRSEEKIHSGSDVHFGRSSSAFVVYDAQGELPIVGVTAFERDDDGLYPSCQLGFGPKAAPGSDGNCDMKWNVARSATVRVADLPHLADCAYLGVTEDWVDGCVRIVSEDRSDDYPRFYAVVSYAYVN